MKLLEDLNWRYAAKKMDTEKKVSEEDIEKVKEVIRLSASSYGLQPFTVLDIRDKAVREKLKPHSWGQSQITDASHLFVFCNQVAVTNDHIGAFMKLKAEITGAPLSALAGYGDFVINKLKEKSKAELVSWTAKQAYIALGSAMVACAELRIDSTPMEGFDAREFDRELGLAEQGLTAAVVLAIGYRSTEDSYQPSKKVRKPIDDLFKVV